MFKTETHLHTAEVSSCAQLSAEQMIRGYKGAGFQTVFVSDHFYPAFFERYGNIPWEEKITIFLSGYYRAKAVGDKYGMNVLLSAEVAFRKSPNHYLIYGFDRSFLDAYPNITDRTIEEFAEIAKKHQVFIVQAHPFRDGICTPTPEYVDGIEVYNSNPRHTDYSEKSLQTALVHHLFMTSGSDSHREEDIGRGGICTAQEIKTAQDYIRLLKDGQVQIYRGEKDN